MTTEIAEIFIRAVRAGHVSLVHEMLAAGVDANIRSNDESEAASDLHSIGRRLHQFVRDKIIELTNGVHSTDDESRDEDKRRDPGVYTVEEDHYDEDLRRHWYPIQHAAYLPDGTDARDEVRSQMMKVVLDHEPNCAPSTWPESISIIDIFSIIWTISTTLSFSYIVC